MEVVHAKIGQNTQELMHNIHVILHPPPTDERRCRRVGSDLPDSGTRHLRSGNGALMTLERHQHAIEQRRAIFRCDAIGFHALGSGAPLNG
jgi:hypothetical protein